MRILNNIFVLLVCSCLMMSCVATTNRFGNVVESKRVMAEFLIISAKMMQESNLDKGHCTKYHKGRANAGVVEMRAQSLLTIAGWMEKAEDKRGAEELRMIGTFGLAIAGLYKGYWNDQMMKCTRDLGLKNF